MTNEQMKHVMNEVKQLDTTEHSYYQNIVCVLRALDDSEERMKDVSSGPSVTVKTKQ